MQVWVPDCHTRPTRAGLQSVSPTVVKSHEDNDLAVTFLRLATTDTDVVRIIHGLPKSAQRMWVRNATH